MDSRSVANKTLYEAAREGDINTVRLLLQSGADTNKAINNAGGTPLYTAARHGHFDVVGLLLESGADTDIASNNGMTPLYTAADKGHLYVVKLLLDSGADTDIASNDGMTPLYRAADKDHLHIVKLLLESGAGTDIASNDGNTPLYRAVNQGHLDTVKLLLKSDADTDIADKYGNTPLYAAVEQGHHHVVRLLLESGANTDIACNDGYTPLYLAADKDHLYIVKLLIDRGADTDIARNDGRTPLYRAANQDHRGIVKLLLESDADTDIADKYGQTPLYTAAGRGHLHIVKLLLDSGADTDIACNDGMTPLYTAAERGQLDVVGLLLESEAGTDIANKYGYTPLYRAADQGQLDVMKLLLDNGADTDIADNKYGETPLHKAAKKGRLDVVRLLLESGADTDIADNNGRTPLIVAMKNNKDEVVRLLIDSGADISNVINDPRLLSFVPRDYVLNLLKLRLNKLDERPSNVVEIKKQIYSLLHGYINCDSTDYTDQLGADLLNQLVSHVNNTSSHHATGWEERSIDIHILSLLKDKDVDKEKGCGAMLYSFLIIVVNFILPSVIITKVKSLHITNCKIISVKKVIFYFVLMILHVYDIGSDFYVGISDIKSEEDSTRNYGYLEFGFVLFALLHENTMSSFYMFKVERTILAEKKKKKESELTLKDWQESPLNFSENKIKLLFFKLFFPFKVTKKKKTETQSEDRNESLHNNSDNKFVKFFKWFNGKISSLFLNLLSFLMLRPVVDRFRILSHKQTSIRVLEIKKAHQKFLQQSYGVLEQLLEILLQMYTLQIALKKSGTFNMDLIRISSLIIPLYALPRGYLSLEKLFRNLDPLSNILPFYNIFLILYILITACRLFMISTILHIVSLVYYIYGYFVIRIILSICYNIRMTKKNIIFGSKTSTIRNLWHFLILSLRQNIILSIRHVYGYILLPHKVTHESIRQSSHLRFDCLIFLFESIVMLVLSEIFHDGSDTLNFFYDIGMWAGALVTVLCVCCYLMTIDFLHPKNLFENVKKEKFSLLIYKQFTFRLGFLVIVGWLYAYLNLKHNYLHYQLFTLIFLAGIFLYIVIYFLVYYFIIRAEGKKSQSPKNSETISDESRGDIPLIGMV